MKLGVSVECAELKADFVEEAADCARAKLQQTEKDHGTKSTNLRSEVAGKNVRNLECSKEPWKGTQTWY